MTRPNHVPRSSIQPSRNQRRRLWERLEERVLFDAETGEFLAMDVPSDSGDSSPVSSFDVQPEVQTNHELDSTPEAPADPLAVSASAGASQIVFVDITVEDFESLLTEIDSSDSGLDIVFLHPQRDGLQQIAEALNGRQELDAVHLISHASEGRLHLGGSTISSDDLESIYADELSAIGRSLSANGDILLYGCDLSTDELGDTFARTLSALTGADVAASDDTTGNVESGGDWDLETHVGLIETQTLWVTSVGSIWQGTLAPVPEVSIDVPAEEFINEGFGFSVTFENTSSTPSDAGFAPYFDLRVPAGVNVTGAAIFGGNLTPIQAGVFNADGDLTDGMGAVITHPVTGLAVTGNEGDSLLIYQLPFGSFVPGQPDATVDFSAELVKADGAVVGTPLDLSATGFFALGATPQDEAAGDPPIIGATATDSITPTVWDVVKQSDASEGERSTGPNYPITFTVTLDIANGETVDNVILDDLLPPSWVYVANSASVTSGLASTISEPVADAPQNSPNNQLSVSFGSVTGTTGVEAVVTYQAWISDEDANNADVIDPVTGAFTPATNDSRATGLYEGNPIVDNDAATDVTISQESLSIQKSIVTPGSGDTRLDDATPGDTVEYILNIQVSDYFEFGDLVIDDNFSDGQLFDAVYGITYTINEEGSTTTGSFTSSQFTVTPRSPADPLNPNPGEGDTDVQIDLSSVIADGVLTGDLFDDSTLDGATTVQVRFRTIIQEEFRHDFPSGDRSVDTGDILRNNVVITGRNLDGTNDTNLVQDGSATSFSITGPVIEKTVYAIDGQTSRANEPITAGHTITYRLRFETSTADFENLVLTDFLPLPIYDATEITAFASGGGSATAPAAGFFSYGPDHTFDGVPFNTPGPGDPPLTVNPPTLSTNSDSNSVRFDFGSFDADNSGAEVIDLLFTVTASDLRFADGLLLTNQANATYGLTNAAPASSNAIAQNLVAAPELTLTKGVVSTNGTTPTFSQTASPNPFSAPGTTGVPFAGSITAADLDSTPIDADLSNVDGGDLVRIAIVIENTGNADGFDLSVVDSLLPEYATPAAGHNVQVHRGNGDHLSFTGDLFAGGIEITDPASDDGALNNEADGMADGSNVIVITYDVELRDTVETNQVYDSTATITDYGAVDNGANHATGLPVEDLSDNATIQVQNAALSKSIISTSESHTGFLGGIERVAIGETVRYRLVMEVPEGTTPDLILNDRLRGGLQFIDDGTATVALISDSGMTSTSGTAGLTLALPGAAAITGSTIVAPTFVLPDANVGSSASLTTDVDTYNDGTDVRFKLGTIINSDNDANVEFVVVEFNAVVTNTNANNIGRTLRNDVQASIDPSAPGGRQTLGTSNQANVRVVEPRIDDLDITVTPALADAGDRVFYEVTFSNDNTNATSDAFDLQLIDLLPSDLTLDLSSVNVATTGTVTGVSDNSSGNSVDISFDRVAKGGGVTVTFEATLNQSVQPSETISTTAALTFTSLPGSGSTVSAPMSATPGSAGTSNGERTDTGGVNDHRDTDAVSFSVTQPGITKNLISTSIDNASNANDEAVIGELATYELVLTIPEGTMNDAVVIDTLETGLVFESLDSVIVDGAISRTPSNAVSASVAGQQVSFDLGDLSNTDRDVNGETITIRYTVRVANIATNQGENAGTELSNAARLRWDLDGSPRTTATQTVDLNVIEPDLQLAFTGLPDPIDSGDTVTFELVVSHTGASDTDAFDVLLSQVLPPELGSVSIVSANHSADGDITAEFAFTNATNTVATSDADGFDLALGETVTIVVNAQVNQASNPGQTLTSNANIQWSSLDGNIADERTGSGGVDDYRVDRAVMLAVSDPATSKTILSTSVANVNNDDLTEATIGELIRYRVSVRIPESTIDNARIIDTLDEGLEFVSLDSVRTLSDGSPTALVTLSTPTGPSIATVSANRTQLTFDFGQMVNTDNLNGNAETLEIEYTVRVANATSNQEGDLLGNDAFFTWTRGGVADSTTPASASDVLILEPTLVVQHDISSATGDASDAIVYTSVISHASSSDTDAYDTVYIATLPTDFVPNSSTSFTVSHSVSGDISSQFEIVGNQLRTRVNGDFDLGLTENVTIQIFGTVDTDVQPQDTLVSDASITWTSLDGNLAERTGVDGEPASPAAPLNNYAASDDASFTVDAIQLGKTLVGTSVTDASNAINEVVIGELVQYSVEITLPEGNANTVLVTDLMDLGLEFVSLDAIVVNGMITSSIGPLTNVGAFEPTVSIDGGTGGQLLRFNLGNLTNSSSTAVGESIQLRYTARVTNSAGNTSAAAATGTNLDNTASLSYDHRGTTESTVTVSADAIEVIEPSLLVTTSISDETPHLGQTVTYTTRIRHTAGSDATAHNVTLQDDLPPGMTLQSVSVSGATIFNNSSTTDTVNVQLVDLAIGQEAIVTYTAVITTDPDAIGDSLPTTPEIQWTSLPDGAFAGGANERDGDGGNAAEDDYTAGTSETATITHPLVELSQTTVSTAPAFGTPGNFFITYDLTVTNTGNDPLSQLTLQEDFRSQFGTGFVGVVGTPTMTTQNAANPIEANTGFNGVGDVNLFDNTGSNTNQLLAGQSATMRVVIEVDPDDAGAILTNGEFVAQADVTALGQFSGLTAVDLSDDPTNTAEVERDTIPDTEPDDPNTHRFPVLTVTKGIVGPVQLADSGIQGNYDVTYEIIVENDGTTPLVGLTLAEDLQTQFGTSFVRLVGSPSIASTAVDPPGLNGGFTGRTGFAQLFDGSSSRLDPNQTVTVRFVVEVDADASGGIRDAVTGSLDNQAIGTAVDPDAPLVTITDASDDLTDPTNVDPNLDNNPDDPTRLLIPNIVVVKETIGQPVPASSGTAGNYQATFEITLTNEGNEALDTLSLVQDFQADYGNAFVGLVGTPTVLAGSTASDRPEILSGYTGFNGANQIFDNTGGNTSLLASGESVTIRLVAEFDPNAPGAIIDSGDFVSQSTGGGDGVVSSSRVTDLSDDPADGTERDPDLDIDPDDPNRVRAPIISLTKRVVSTPVEASSGIAGNFDVTYEFLVENQGSTPLENLTLNEDLSAHFGSAFIGIVGTPTIDATGIAIPPALQLGYTGRGANINLLDTAVASRIEVNDSFTIRLIVELDADASGRTLDSVTSDGNLDFENQAEVIGFDPNAPTVAVTDLSNDPASSGTRDTDGDNDLDNPTSVILRHITLTQEIIGAPTPADSGLNGNYDVVFELSLTNTGNETLETLSLIEDFQAAYGGAFVGITVDPVVTSTTASNQPEINPGYNGDTDAEIFDNTSGNVNELATGQNVTLRLTVEIDPDNPGRTTNSLGDFITQANVTGTGIQTLLDTTDLSDNPIDFTDTLTDPGNTPDDPNAFRIPLISVTKEVGGITATNASMTPGNFDVTYDLRIENVGSTPLTELSLIENLTDHFGTAFVRIVTPPSITSSDAVDRPLINGNYTGDSADPQVFDSSDPSRLLTGQFIELSITIEVDPDAVGQVEDSVTGDGNGDFENQVIVSGVEPDSRVTVTDASDDPADTRNVDGDPANPADTSDDDNNPDDPTALWLPSITLTKTQIGDIVPASSGSAGNFDVVYDLQLTNNGNEPLETLRLIEDLQSQFGGAFVRVVPQSGVPAVVTASTADDPPEINAGYTGNAAGSTNLFSNSGGDTNQVDTGQSVTVRLVVEFDADHPGGNRVNGQFVNLADVFGDGINSTQTVTDRSDDPVAVDGVDIDNNFDPDDPNFVRVPDVTLTKVITGTPSAAASGIIGNVDVDYEFVVQNTGTTPLENLSVVDEWRAQFGGAFIRIVPGTLNLANIDIAAAGDVPGENTSYSGAAGESLLDGTGILQSGNSFRINVTVEVDPNAVGAIRQIGELVNQAVVSANDPVTPGTPVTDLSDDTNDPTNADGDPVDPSDDDNNPDDPTGFGFADVGLSKRILSAARSTTTAGAMTFTYELVVRNVGSGDLTNLTLTDDLDAGLQDAYVNLVDPPRIVTSNAQQDPSLNNGFDGNLNNAGDSSIFVGTDGLLRPTEQIVLVYSVDVHPDQLDNTSNNQALVGGQNPTDLEIVTDLSDTGVNPEDTNPGPQNDTGDEDDATLIPGLAIVKNHGDPIQGMVNSNEWTVPVTLRVENTGSLTLSSLVLQEDIAAQFGSGFITSTLPTIDTTGVTNTDRPTINGGWVADSSNNLLSGGSLDPGDSFTITFDVVIDPDRSGASSIVTNQSTIEGFDPNDPSIGAFDESDSGSITSSDNPGEPGDTGTTDDPTPLQIAEIGAAKRVTNVELVGLNASVTIEMTVENTGTVHLRNLDLFDDLTDQFGDNFVRVASPPQILRSNADIDPNLNASYVSDTTENIFDGASGTLAPGQEIVIRVVVNVTATPGQSTVTLENQTNVAGDPVDAAGNPIRDDAGTPIPRVTDLSDSGADASSTNPGAPGDTGGYDDPTPTEITFFTFDNLNNFSEPFGTQRENGDHHHNRLLTKEIGSLAPDPLFSGAARPGTKIVARLYDSNGFQIGSEEAFADVGGNWMMQVHNLDNQDYTRVVFEEVSGSIETFAPSGDPYGYLGQDQHRNQYTALEPWANYGHEYDFNAIYRGSARQALAHAHRQANRAQGFGV